MKKRFGIIVNPAAGNGKSLQDLPQIKSLFERYAIDYDLYITEKPQHATAITRTIKKDHDAIIVFGGDGTINEVVNGLLGSEVPLGIIPHGRGNDFIRSINIMTDYDKAVQSIISQRIRTVDVGKINDIYFINGIGVGLDGYINRESQKLSDKGILSSHLAYYWTLLKAWLKWQAVELRVEIDNKVVMEEKAYLVAIGNGRACGGGILLNPEALLDDGKLNISFVSQLPKTKLLYKFGALLNGKIGQISEVSQFIGKKIKIFSDHNLPVHYDGEVYMDRHKELNISTVPQAINVFAG